jgi:putative hemolysin
MIWPFQAPCLHREDAAALVTGLSSTGLSSGTAKPAYRLFGRYMSYKELLGEGRSGAHRMDPMPAVPGWAENASSAKADTALGDTVVDRLIAERAPHLVGTRAGRWLTRNVLYPLLDYGTAVDLARRVEPMGGHAIFQLMARELDVRLLVSGLENLPSKGRCIVVSNHPTGLADGIAVYEALRRRRQDLWFLANADALRVASRLDEIIIPVEWMQNRRSHASMRDMLTATARVFGAGQCLVVFPSGRLSYVSAKGLRERPWQPTVVSLARRYQASVVPMRIVARNSTLFYTFSQLSRELRDITLFHELLNKRGRLFEIHLAPPLDPHAVAGDAAAAAKRLQQYVESGMRDPSLLTSAGRPSARLALAATRT